MKRTTGLPRRSLALVALVGLFGIAHAEETATPTDLEDLLAQYRNVSLAESGVAATGQIVQIGRLQLTFFNGEIVPIQSSGGHVMGFVFDGRGKYVYRSEDPADQQVIANNLEGITNAGILTNHKVSDSINRMLVFMGKPAFEELLNPGGDTIAPAATTQKAFDRIWKRIGKTYLEYDHFAAEARLNGGDRQYVFAEIEGAQETVGYSYDSVRNFRERLFTFRKFSGYDLRFTRRISSQNLPAGERRTSPVKLRHGDFEVRTEDNRSASIRAAMRYEVGADETTIIPLLLDNHRDPDNYDWKAKRNVYEVKQVTDASGRPLPFSHRYHEVLVQLPEPVSAGEQVELRFEMQGEILTGMNGDRYDNYFELFSNNWFPKPFGRGTKSLTFKLNAQTKKPYRPVASGTLLAFREEAETYAIETESTEPVQWIGLFAGKYKVHEETFGNRTIRIHGYAAARKKNLENMAKLTNGIIEFYEKILTPYPFKQLDIVEVPEYGFGIAMPGMVLITTEAYKPHQDYLTEYISRGINARLAHEVAHQWFGHLANPRNTEDWWIAESLAEYVSGMAIAVLVGKNPRVMGYDDMFEQWRRATYESKDAGPMTAANLLSGPSAGMNRFKLLYSRGPYVMRMLHSTVGNDRFYGILKKFLQDADFGYVTTADFQKAAESVIGEKMDWFIDDWIKSGGVPEVKIDHEVMRSGGKTMLTGTARFAEGSDPKRLIIPLVMDLGRDRPSILAIDLDQPVKEFSFELPAKPKSIKIDPAHNCVARFN